MFLVPFRSSPKKGVVHATQGLPAAAGTSDCNDVSMLSGESEVICSSRFRCLPWPNSMPATPRRQRITSGVGLSSHSELSAPATPKHATSSVTASSIAAPAATAAVEVSRSPPPPLSPRPGALPQRAATDAPPPRRRLLMFPPNEIAGRIPPGLPALTSPGSALAAAALDSPSEAARMNSARAMSPPATPRKSALASEKTPAVVSVTVLQARHLHLDQAQSCRVQVVLEVHQYQQQVGFTRALVGGQSPVWSELFNFTVADDALHKAKMFSQQTKLICTLFTSADGWKWTAWGSMQLPVHAIMEVACASPVEAWYDLEPLQDFGNIDSGMQQAQLQVIIKAKEPGVISEKRFSSPSATPRCHSPRPSDSCCHSPRLPSSRCQSPLPGGQTPCLIADTCTLLRAHLSSLTTTDQQQQRHVALERWGQGSKGTLGIAFSKISVEGPVVIDMIDPEGSAWDDGRLRIGDLILQVDEQSVVGLTGHQVADLISGEPGSKVTITYLPAT